jgi:RNA polymerase-binding transcription factor
MKTPTKDERRDLLRSTLAHLRDETYAKVVRFRHSQREDSQPVPGDEMDVAWSSTDMERSASLIERLEERVRSIDQAFARVDAGTYGICEECGDEIAVERLRVLPFAALCVDCQSKRKEIRGLVGQSAVEFWEEPPASRGRGEEHGRSGTGSRRGERATSSDGGSGREEPTVETPRSKRRGRPPRRFRAEGS